MKDNSRFGEIVYLRYEGGILGEEPVDSRREGEPLRIILGGGHVIPGIENALCDMHVGEEREVVIPPEEAYGSYQEEGVQTYPRSAIRFGDELKKGDVMGWTNPASGSQIPVKVIDATENTVKVDFNHPFAGKTLKYWIKVVDKTG